VSVSHSSAATKIAVFGYEVSHLPGRLRCRSLRGRFLCQHQAVGGMGAFHRSSSPLTFHFSRAYSRIVSASQSGLRRPLPGLAAPGFCPPWSPCIEQVQVEIAFGVADSFHAFQIASTTKTDSAGTVFCSGRVQKIVAPIHRRAECLLTLRQVAAPPVNNCKRLASRVSREAGEELSRGGGPVRWQEAGHPGACANFGNGGGVIVVSSNPAGGPRRVEMNNATAG